MLDEIVNYKRLELARLKKEKPLDSILKNLPPGSQGGVFAQAISGKDKISLIAEVKKASPSAGVIREDFDPGVIAAIYRDNGASALSVLTDRHFFQGSPPYLREARGASGLPTLRKDFTLDEYHLYEAASMRADAVLLIVAILRDDELVDYGKLAGELGMDALVEVHSKEETKRALEANARIIGINNRDLKTFVTDLATTLELRASIPPEVIVVSESGIKTREDVLRLEKEDIDAILVGESLMRSPDIGAKVRELLQHKPWTENYEDTT